MMNASQARETMTAWQAEIGRNAEHQAAKQARIARHEAVDASIAWMTVPAGSSHVTGVTCAG